MIKKFSDYETTQAYTQVEQLPRGGYVCQIIGAKIEETKHGQRARIAFDIAEGDWKGYFKKKFDANTNEDKKWPGVYMLNVPADDGSDQDDWTKRRFKTFTNALEDSNAGYHFDWDESKFKGKKVGFVFNYREYEFNGNRGLTPNVAATVSVDKIHAEEYKIPNDRMLKKEQAPAENIGEFVSVPADADEELPF